MSTAHNRMRPPEPHGLQIRHIFRPERRSLVVRTSGSRGNDRRFETGRPKLCPEKRTLVGRPSTEKRHRIKKRQTEQSWSTEKRDRAVRINLFPKTETPSKTEKVIPDENFSQLIKQ